LLDKGNIHDFYNFYQDDVPYKCCPARFLSSSWH